MIKLALEQANVALNEVLRTMPSNAQSNPQDQLNESVLKAQEGISEILQDKITLKRMAENIEYEKLVAELKAVEIPISSEEIDIVNQLSQQQD